ncbi:hypothetical protein CR513_16670, partial [Mucuna pruriens]
MEIFGRTPLGHRRRRQVEVGGRRRLTDLGSRTWSKKNKKASKNTLSGDDGLEYGFQLCRPCGGRQENRGGHSTRKVCLDQQCC